MEVRIGRVLGAAQVHPDGEPYKTSVNGLKFRNSQGYLPAGSACH